MKYIKHTDFGATNGESKSVYFMREDGKAMARLYYFFDDKDNGYLDSLSVSPSIRNQGEGTKLQVMREKLLKKMGYKRARLWTKDGSWQMEWYMRRGYKILKKHQREKKCSWMEKEL